MFPKTENVAFFPLYGLNKTFFFSYIQNSLTSAIAIFTTIMKASKRMWKKLRAFSISNGLHRSLLRQKQIQRHWVRVIFQQNVFRECEKFACIKFFFYALRRAHNFVYNAHPRGKSARFIRRNQNICFSWRVTTSVPTCKKSKISEGHYWKSLLSWQAKFEKKVPMSIHGKKTSKPLTKACYAKRPVTLGMFLLSTKVQQLEFLAAMERFFPKRASCDNRTKKESGLLQTYLRQSKSTKSESATKVFKSDLKKTNVSSLQWLIKSSNFFLLFSFHLNSM